MNKKIIIYGLFAVVLALLTACSLSEPRITSTTLATNERAFMSRLAGIGDDIMAGYQSAALVEPHQRNDFLALIARQGETPNFQQPYIHYPGLGTESYAGYGTLELKYLDNPETPNTVIPDPVIDAVPFADYPDFDPTTNPFVDDSVMLWPYPYNNLAVPGIYVDDVLHGVSKLRSRSKSGLLNVIPYLGPLMGAILGMVLAALSELSFGSYDMMFSSIFYVAIVFLGANIIDNTVLQPQIYSKSVKAHPVEIFLAIIIGGKLAGVVGMIFAIPTYTIIKVIIKQFNSRINIVDFLTTKT